MLIMTNYKIANICFHVPLDFPLNPICAFYLSKVITQCFIRVLPITIGLSSSTLCPNNKTHCPSSQRVYNSASTVIYAFYKTKVILGLLRLHGQIGLKLVSIVQSLKNLLKSFLNSNGLRYKMLVLVSMIILLEAIQEKSKPPTLTLGTAISQNCEPTTGLQIFAYSTVSGSSL